MLGTKGPLLSELFCSSFLMKTLPTDPLIHIHSAKGQCDTGYLQTAAALHVNKVIVKVFYFFYFIIDHYNSAGEHFIL